MPSHLKKLVIKPLAMGQMKKSAKIEKLWKDEDIQVVMFRLKCSEVDANEYLQNNLIDEKILKKWKDEGIFK